MGGIPSPSSPNMSTRATWFRLVENVVPDAVTCRYTVIAPPSNPTSSTISGATRQPYVVRVAAGVGAAFRCNSAVMVARALAFTSLLAAACGSKASPVAPSSSGPGGAAPVAAGSTSFELAGAAWTIAVDGIVTADGEYDQKITTLAFELSVMPWPRADAFVQTSGEELDGTRRDDPSAKVLHQADNGEYAFELVLETAGKIDGSVLVADPEGGDGAMCGFELAPGSDWHAALAACASLTRGD